MRNCIECGNKYELHSADSALCPKNQDSVNGNIEFSDTHFDDGLSEVEQLRQALTEANERIEYANAGPLVIIPRELVLAMEAKMKEQAAEIARLTAQCKHARDDEGDMCECGHPISEHTYDGDGEKGCMHRIPAEDGLYCPCINFEVTK